MARVLKSGGAVKVQMPTRFGLRCLYHQARRGFRKAGRFEVRYWTIPQLRRLFTGNVGPTQFEVDGFFGIGLQPTDRAIMPPVYQVVLAMSEKLKRASRRLSCEWLIAGARSRFCLTQDSGYRSGRASQQRQMKPGRKPDRE